MFKRLFNLCLALFLILVLTFYTGVISENTFTIIFDYFYPLSLMMLSGAYIYENKKFNILLVTTLTWSTVKLLNNIDINFNYQLGSIIILILLLIFIINIIHKITKNKDGKNLEVHFENKLLALDNNDLEYINYLNILSCFGIVEVVLPKGIKINVNKFSVLSKIDYKKSNNDFNKKITINCTSLFSKINIKQ